MDSKPLHVAFVALATLLGSAGCSLLFDESAEAGESDASVNESDAGVGGTDALPIACLPHTCDSETKMLFHFDAPQPLGNDCVTNVLEPDTGYQVSSSIDGLGNGLRISGSTQFRASTIDLTGSWTLDFWLRPGNKSGDLLSLIESTISAGGDCGFKTLIVDSQLQVYWTVDAVETKIFEVNVALQNWSHIALSYTQDTPNGTVILSIGAMSMPAMEVTACDKTTTTMTLGNFGSPGDDAAAEAGIDQIRLQDKAVLTPAPCASL